MGVPKPIQEDEFGRLNLGDIDVWLWSHTVAPDTYKGKFISALWDIFLEMGRWAELASNNRWVLPTADDLRNNVFAWWTWPDGSIKNDINPHYLAACTVAWPQCRHHT